MMEWNVYRHNFNKSEIEVFNIFNHYSFYENVKKHFKKYTNKEEFAEELKRSLMYYFWCKSEYEIVLTSWTPRIKMEELDRLNTERKEHIKEWDKEPYSLYVEPDVFKKVDIYDQVMNNFDIFVDYCWRYRNDR